MSDDAEPQDDDIDRALLEGVLTELQAPLRPGQRGAVARWVGARSAGVLEYSYDDEAEPGNEYDATLWTYTRTLDGTWELNGGPGTDCPMVPGDRPIYSTVSFPIEGLTTTTGAGNGSILTFGVAASEVMAVEMHSAEGLTRSEVGAFGAVIVATEAPPAELVLIGRDNRPLVGDWQPQVHDHFTARSRRAGPAGPTDR